MSLSEACGYNASSADQINQPLVEQLMSQNATHHSSADDIMSSSHVISLVFVSSCVSAAQIHRIFI